MSLPGNRGPAFQPPLDVITQGFVFAVDKTAFLSTWQNGPVRVADDPVGQSVVPCRPDSFQGLVSTGSLREISLHLPVPENQVSANDDTDIIKLQSLGGVYAPDLFKGVFIDGEGLGVAEVPLSP